jgi:hypothetical protein
MTTPTKSTAAKSTPVKAAPAPVVEENEVTDNAPEEKAVNRIPEALSNQSILADFARRYLDVFDEIAAYNKDVLAEKTSDWNAAKVLEKARELARPTDKNVKPNEDIKKAVETWENLINEMNRARKTLLDMTSKELGITLSSTSERDPALEAPLRDKRKFAIEIGTQLSMIAKMTTDEAVSEAATEFLAKNALPAIGRDQVRKFGEDGKSTPKYRVHIKIVKGSETLLEEDGFTKTSQALSNPKFGYERGKSLKSEDLRKAWEKSGNTPEKTVTNPVEFDDNGLHYVITKK